MTLFLRKELTDIDFPSRTAPETITNKGTENVEAEFKALANHHPDVPTIRGIL